VDDGRQQSVCSAAEAWPEVTPSEKATVGSFYAADVSIEAVNEFVRSIGLPDDDQTIFSFLKLIHQPDAKAKAIHERVVAFVAERMANDENSRLMRFAERGIVDKIKQQGFYVDISNDGKIVSSPTSMTRETASEWLAHARNAIGRLPIREAIPPRER
jgi:hypothetical protein